LISSKERMEQLQSVSEKLFRKACSENDFAYMYIDQSKETFASKIWKSKRPDYLMSIPHMGSIFIDVKAYKEDIFYRKAYEKLEESPPITFNIDLDELYRFNELQDITSMKVWFAIMPVHNDTVTEGIFFLPVDRVEKFKRERHRLWKNWFFVQVPKKCCSEGINITTNVCINCKKKYCERLDELLEIEDKISGTVGHTECPTCGTEINFKKKG